MTPESAFCALQRQHMAPFVWRAFGELHPGTPFEPNWHIDAMCKALEDVYHGTTRRLLITVPPRHLKSICTTVGFSAWALGKSPSLKIITASYGNRLAEEHMHSFRQLIETPWYQRLFPHVQIDPRRNRASEIKTTSQGARYSVSKGGSITGIGADILIVDDLLKAGDAYSEAERESADQFFRETLLSRLDDKLTGRVIVIQQRLHEDDIAGRLIRQGDYAHLNLPAIAQERQTFDLGFGRTHVREPGDLLFEAREPRSVLDDLRREMGEQAFNAQYQQNPIPPNGGMVRWDWFPTYDERPARETFSKIVQSWDTGMSAQPDSDYSVCLTFGFANRCWHLLDVYRRQLDFPDLAREVRRLQDDWQADTVIIEKQGAGTSLLQDLRRDRPGRAIYRAHTPTLSKEERLRGQTPKLESGLIAVPSAAPWCAELRHELQGFPFARHDDRVDALSQFLWHISKHASWLDPDKDRSRRRRRRS